MTAPFPSALKIVKYVKYKVRLTIVYSVMLGSLLNLRETSVFPDLKIVISSKRMKRSATFALLGFILLPIIYASPMISFQVILEYLL